ncbi:sirohydrochlorin chelatase [Salinisphaera sp. Q1T1-3]|uniref:sirohydrochlorin chelatase n=1 Tax=Salinisphaera sp. Q1T1-3 TaxID=2321229 RepID=UPI000E70E74A|nr:CbiX/SirB N-terminal domain-containing protein [Salinisphaera sp. Q1T1-3]RJS90956.1 cobalamin biosynthesis protein CbiX [Salinisphaera sp. Q1T1-3]
MKKSLLLVAHGSRRAASNDEVRTLTDRLRADAASDFADIACAFLELADPSIPDGLAELAERGAEHITVLPYFLAAGRHVAEDIPAEVETARAAHPEVAIEIAPYLGTSDALPRLLLEMLGDSAVAAG